jgi:hypothetical protein
MFAEHHRQKSNDLADSAGILDGFPRSELSRTYNPHTSCRTGNTAERPMFTGVRCMLTVLGLRYSRRAFRGVKCRQLSARNFQLRIDPDSTVVVTDGCPKPTSGAVALCC